MSKRPEDNLPDDGGSAATPGGHDRCEPGEPAGSHGTRPREIGGRQGPDPTRYGDWEKNGRCIDF
jgi:hypothetical protein